MAVQVNPPVFNENGDRQTGGFFPGIFVSGYDNKFICRYCHRILRDPVQSQCGHRFCRSCLDELLRNDAIVVCPACIDENVEEQDVGQLSLREVFPDNAVKREMYSTPAVCIFPGCSWKGRFKEYEVHERTCPFKQVACALCAQPVTDGHIEEHRRSECPERQVICDYCGTTVVFSRMNAHLETCEKLPLTCERCGKNNIPRDAMKLHLEQHCPKRIVTCPMGCEEKFQQDKFSEHLRLLMETHLAWTVQKLVDLEIVVGSTSAGSLPASNLAQVMGEIRKVEKKIQSVERQLQHAVQGRSERDSSDGAISNNKDTATPQLSPEAAAKTSLKLVEPILGVIHHELDKATLSLHALEGHYRQQQAQLDEMENQLRQQQQQLQLKDAALADLEMRLAAQEMARYDGTILWKISGFDAKKREAISGQTTSLYSPAFYSGPCGYKMCARIYPNGDGIGKGSHISLFFVIMRGHYDALLPWPFTQKVTLMMIDQNQTHKEHILDAFRPDSSSSSFKRPTTEMNIASGCPLFLPLEKLNSRQRGYLKDDTIFVKIIVDTDGLSAYTDMNPNQLGMGYP
ncbi:hypothetical protein RRG08_030737 [Elysia crispata]|nr:hypothetical protein RRG08_030737 [Elysia crispata]